MKTMVILIVAFLTGSARASDEWEVVRPTVLLMLDATGQYVLPPSEFQEELTQAIQLATSRISGDERAVVRFDTEIILVVERPDEWLVAFFGRGNGRLAKVVDGKIIVGTPNSSNPRVVSVTKGPNAVVRFANEWKAELMPIQLDLGIATEYSNETELEKHFNVERQAKEPNEPN